VLVDELLAASAARNSEKKAVVCAGARWNYGQIDRAADGFAAALIGVGAAPGDRIALCLGNSIETVVSIFGVLRAGCPFVLINPQASAQHLCSVLEDCGASVLCASARRLEAMRTVAARLPALRSLIEPDVHETRSRVLPTRRAESDVAALVYTSGSTGEPKGVMLTHRNLVAAASAINTYLENTADDVILNALPLSFTYGLGQLTTAFRVGATLVLEPSFAYPRTVFDTIGRERVTGLPLVPTMAALLQRDKRDGAGVRCLRYITNAAAALPVSAIRRMNELWPTASLYSMYGQTECQRALYLPPHELADRPGSVGISIPGTSVSIVDDEGRPVPSGATGELLVRGPQVMTGYWNRPEATRAVLQSTTDPGTMQLRTRDLFRADASGFLYFVARTDDVIKCGGEKVAPTQIEDVIAELPGVLQVSVFGMPHEVLGEVPAAVLTLAGGAALTADAIRRHCFQRLDAHKVPHKVTITDRLPTTLTGKISRRAVKAAALGERCTA